MNPTRSGTKAAAHYVLDLPARGMTVRLRLTSARGDEGFGGFEETFKSRIADADEFYDSISRRLNRKMTGEFTARRSRRRTL